MMDFKKKTFYLLGLFLLVFGLRAEEGNIEDVPPPTPAPSFQTLSKEILRRAERGDWAGVKNFYDNKFRKILMEEKMKEGPLSKVSSELARKLIFLQAKQWGMDKYLEENPKVMNFLVASLQDKEAIPQLFSVIHKPEKIKRFTIGAIVILFSLWGINIVIGYFQQKYQSPWYKRLIHSLVLWCLFSSLQLFWPFYIFGDELRPLMTIFYREIF